MPKPPKPKIKPQSKPQEKQKSKPQEKPQINQQANPEDKPQSKPQEKLQSAQQVRPDDKSKLKPQDNLQRNQQVRINDNPKVKPQIIVTSALPYANGPIHVGHLVEYIQTDIYVRFLKLTGENALYCCADDTHGTPIQILAEKEGILPEQLIQKYHQEHLRDFTTFSIAFDSYYSTNSEENRLFSDLFFERLKKKNLIYTKEVELSYCLRCRRFLPDRYIKGKCPKCHAPDQYGDVCEKCNATHSTTELIDPFCAVCGTPPVKKKSDHYFFKLSAFARNLQTWFDSNRSLQPEIKHYLENWIKEGLQDWDISRDGPYFGFKIPGEEDKYYYVWLDAPIGYISSFTHAIGGNISQGEKVWNSSKITHFIGKDIIYFHFLFWPAMLEAADFKLPESIVVHGFLTVNGEKMSKSRGTFFTAEEFAGKYPPEFLRFYYGKSLSKKLADINLDFKDFHETVNNELVGNIANYCYRVLSFTNRFLSSEIGEKAKEPKLEKEILEKAGIIKKAYESLNFNEAVKEILAIADLGNQYFQKNEPWKLVKEDKVSAQKIVALSLNIVKILSILISPILPGFAKELQSQLGADSEKAAWKDISFNFENKVIGEAKIVLNKIEAEAPDIRKKEMHKEINVSTSEEAKALGIKVVWARIDNVEVKNKAEGLEKYKKSIIEEIKNKDFSDNPYIKGYHELYRSCRIKGGETPPEYLLRLIKEKGRLPSINTAVDAYNLVSLNNALSLGAHDIKKIKGSVAMKVSQGAEEFIPLGSKEPVNVKKGEYICADDEHVLCWLDIKQGAYTPVDTNTKSVLLYAQGNKDTPEDSLRKAIDEACSLITKYCGGEYVVLSEQKVSEPFPLDLKVGMILEAKDHPDAEKLYILQVDLGNEKRQLVAGLKGHYQKEALLNKKIIVVANLKPAKLKGILSSGMLLAADDGKTVEVLEPEGSPGDKVTCGNQKNSTETIPFEEFQKINLIIKNGCACCGKNQLSIKGKTIKALKAGDGAKVR